MSAKQMKDFYKKITSNTALRKRIEKAPSRDDVIRNAVKEARAQGYDFKFTEAKAWAIANVYEKKRHTLANRNLEATAGGKEID